MKANGLKASPARLAATAVLAAASLAFMGCYYMPGLGGAGTSKVNLRTAAAPSSMTVSSIALVVSGPEMGTITSTYTAGTTTATLTVPSGVARTFTLLENTPSVTLIGTATVDLAPGETTSVVLTPMAGASQIIVPDYWNNRLAQIGDMSGTGWTTLSVGSPYDVKFDAQGYVYVASSASVYRYTDITNSTPVLVGSTAQGLPVKSIAVDRARGLLYFTDGGILYGIQVTPTVGTLQSVALSAITAYSGLSVMGITVDSDGFIYMAGMYGAVAPITPVLLKIDPTTFTSPSVVAFSTGTLSSPWDVLVNGDYIYVSDFGAKKIVRFTKSLGLVDSYSGLPSDPFRGPERFVAILNKPITVIDEGGTGGPDRLIAFNDMTGAGWTKFGSTGSVSAGPAVDQFLFYTS